MSMQHNKGMECSFSARQSGHAEIGPTGLSGLWAKVWRQGVVGLLGLEEGPKNGPDEAQHSKQVEDEGPAQAGYDWPTDHQPNGTAQIQATEHSRHCPCSFTPASS